VHLVHPTESFSVHCHWQSIFSPRCAEAIHRFKCFRGHVFCGLLLVFSTNWCCIRHFCLCDFLCWDQTGLFWDHGRTVETLPLSFMIFVDVANVLSFSRKSKIANESQVVVPQLQMYCKTAQNSCKHERVIKA